MGIVAEIFPSSVPVVRHGYRLCSSLIDPFLCRKSYFFVSRFLVFCLLCFGAAVVIQWRYIYCYFKKRRAEQIRIEQQFREHRSSAAAAGGRRLRPRKTQPPAPSRACSVAGNGADDITIDEVLAAEQQFVRQHGHPVDRAALDEGLNQLGDLVSDPVAGLLSVDRSGVAARVGCESVVMLGGVGAVLDQLAHPFVAYGIAQHSYTRSAPQLRFYNTFRYVFAIMFGSWAEVQQTSRHVFRTHSRISGQLDDAVAGYAAGAPYAALDESAALWVLATLGEYSLTLYEAMVAPLSLAEKEAYYRWTVATAPVWGIRPAAMPATYRQFRAYMHAMWCSPAVLGTSKPARNMAEFLLMPPPWERALGVNGMPTLAAFMLPPAVARHFGLPDSSLPSFGTRALLVSFKLAIVKVMYNCLPGPVRHFTKYRRYLHRVRQSEPRRPDGDGPSPPVPGRSAGPKAQQHYYPGSNSYLTWWELIANKIGSWIVDRTLSPPS